MSLLEPLHLAHGPALKNRMLLAPMTNNQSNPDGTASEDDLSWISLVAAGGYSMIMTAGMNVQRNGQSFAGQPGIYDDRHLDGLTEIASIIRDAGSASSVQLHHGGERSLGGQYGQPYAMSRAPGARQMSTAEVEQLRDDFITAAVRAKRAGFDGAEVHGAFGWIISMSLSPIANRRTDKYGGDLEGRSRLLFEILDGMRRETGPDFQIGLRLSTERYGISLYELRDVAQEAMHREAIDYLDLAPWDVNAIAVEPGFENRPVLSIFTELDRKRTRIGTSGKVMTGAQASAVMDAGCDFVMLGRAAILEPNAPRLFTENPHHRGPETPVSYQYLRDQGLSDTYVDYLLLAFPALVSAA
ncbi:MAG: Probable NADH-dependent flavin oxidoreductase yqiG (EC [uncultured Arthrobacter sp.]|uniref:Probable NADH-dependent flavin oxidoreductase yqiG (EC) n=1 Tax=uncultured Arthrobacter sp. TaxID=114050 RepID=A0A6J4J7Z5_9MICC|nr:NADH:flavin oxidoreductase [uncultured Arthrobacter sp.]CAA9271454.1 MAG: Probable NADH-dependent flavin oxidoreductase yqiG (EC [uncultured Arthrobacter sp.]